ncbi:phosphoribulokinase [Methylobacterium sp. SyP6R]|uniref:phosphoribulokinase n=1 Tax=Methylobacterium sp. SyP6R TaxID=2718876 RepID=UPI001F00FEFF|nr:phosphoribulokinase [Methylobacterium sp. SyP6R]MCF4127168.1 phosphoribulokinase [Methylobacterium sp. SyP6R]
MSALHPIVSVTGSSGSGTTSVRNTFEQIFRREGVEAVFIEGDAFHAFDRAEMRAAEAREPTLSHFGERANLLAELEAVFREYAASGRGRTRHYVHDAEDAARFRAEPGTFTPWEDFAEGSDLLFYEGLHGALVNERVDIAGQADLRIGVVPVINLEWIQKLHRDKAARGYSIEAVTDVILRRMPDYVTTICPQFTNTDINFQRIPTVDTSNPFVARWIPTADESMVVIRFRDPKGIDFPYLISMIAGSFMSRANSVVIPGGKLDLAMQLILTPMILRLVERRRRLL